MSGVGYKIFCSPGTLRGIPNNQETEIFTHLHLKEDAIELYGFLNQEDLIFFKMLIGISGIGPKSALGILSIEKAEKLKAYLYDLYEPAYAYLNFFSKPKEEKKWFKALKLFYKKVIMKALKHKYKVMTFLTMGFIGTIIFAVFVYKIKVILFSGEGIEDFYIRAEAPKGTSLEHMEELMMPVEEFVRSMRKDELESFRTYIGSISQEMGFDPNSKNGSHLAQVTVFLTPMQTRERDAKVIIDEMREGLKKIGGFDKPKYDLSSQEKVSC